MNPNIFDIYIMDFMGIWERVGSFGIIATVWDQLRLKDLVVGGRRPVKNFDSDCKLKKLRKKFKEYLLVY